MGFFQKQITEKRGMVVACLPQGEGQYKITVRILEGDDVDKEEIIYWNKPFYPNDIVSIVREVTANFEGVYLGLINRNQHKPEYLTQSVMVSVFAGSGEIGSEDGIGEVASFNYPTSVAVDSLGNVYVADSRNYKIRKISPSGIVSTFVDTTGGENKYGYGEIYFHIPSALAVDALGNVFTLDKVDNIIRKISPAGIVIDFAGSGEGNQDGMVKMASFFKPRGIAVDSLGNVYVVDMVYDYDALYEYDIPKRIIRKIDHTGMVSTLSSTAIVDDNDDLPIEPGVYITRFEFEDAFGIAIDALGNIYVQDSSYIKIIDPKLHLSTLVKNLDSTHSELAVDASGNVYASYPLEGSIIKINSKGKINTVASLGAMGIVVGGTRRGLAVDAVGNVYVADSANNKILKISFD